MLVSKLLVRFAPYILGAALLFCGISGLALKGWWNERQDRIEAQASLELATDAAESSAETAKRLRESKERGATELAAYKKRLSQVEATDCFSVVPMPDDAIGVLNEASRAAAARSLGGSN